MKSFFSMVILLLSATAFADERSPDKHYDCLQNCSASVCPIELSLCADVESKPPVSQCVASCMATNIVKFPNAVVDSVNGNNLASPTNVGASCQNICDPGTTRCHPVCSQAAAPSTVNGIQNVANAQATNCHTVCLPSNIGQSCHQYCAPPPDASQIPQGWVGAQSTVKDADAARVLPSRAADRQTVEDQFSQLKAETSDAEIKRRALANQVAADKATAMPVVNEAISAYESEVNAPEPTYDVSGSGDPNP